MTRNFHFRLLGDVRGTSAVEFAIVAPVFLMLVVGLISTCLLLFSIACMHYAVEEGARCASVKATVCPDSGTTLTYTKAAYYGPLILPTFAYTVAPCGYSVSGSANFSLNIGLSRLTVPLSATACYP
jgi:hypothetical protein